jgi:hypothetical protein
MKLCNECGESDHEVLQFDHIDNDGINGSKYGVAASRYRKYINTDLNIQLLCCNCHQIKSVNKLKV